MSKFNLPCPQNNDRECDHCHGVNAQDGWRFRGCFCPPNRGKYVADVKECPLGHRKENEL